MTASSLDVRRGAQRPRLVSVPDRIVSTAAGREAVDLAELAGLHLDPWQAWFLEHSLAERADGRYAAFEVVGIVPRQNGKGSIIEARELALLFLLGEKLGMHSTHQFDTTLEAFGRLLQLIESTPDLDRQVAKTPTGNGKEAIITKTGSRIRFRARTRKGGRGFAGVDLLVLDEAQELPDTAIGSVIPTLSTRPRAQAWFTGSAVDQRVHPDGLVLARLRNRLVSGTEERLFGGDWSAGEREDLEAGRVDIDSVEALAMANPSLGYRLTLESSARERGVMTDRQYEVERLGIGDWPDVDEGESVINAAKWASRAIDPTSEDALQELEPVAFGVECAPDRSYTSIAVAGRRSDGQAHVEIAMREPGVSWAYEWLVRAVEGRRPCALVIDPGGPAGFMIAKLTERDVKVEEPTARELSQACVGLTTLVDEGGIVHVGDPLLTAAVRAVGKRKLGESWAFERHNPKAELAPLMAVTLALHGLTEHGATGGFNIW